MEQPDLRIDALLRRLLERLDAEQLELLVDGPRGVAAEDYAPLIQRAGRRARLEEELFVQARARIESRYHDFEELPEGRRELLLRNSSPPMLLALAGYLMKTSYGERFDDVERSLRLARLAVEVVDRIEETAYLSPASFADVRAEAWGLLGNAHRINSDLSRAETALLEARRAMDAGTGDRALRADYLSLLASLRSAQRRPDEAVDLIDREISLRRLLGDPERLGTALIERGRLSYWLGGLTAEVCQYMRDGIEQVEDPRFVLLALLNLAEAFAREGRGIEAVKLLAQAHLQLHLVVSRRNELRYRSLKGLAYLSLGRLDTAESLLRSTRLALVEEGELLHAAVASMDLLAVYAGQGRYREAAGLAEYARQVFLAERLEQPALAALLALREAVSGRKA